MKSKIDAIVRELARPKRLFREPKLLKRAETAIKALKKKCAERGEDGNLNLLWCLGETVSLQTEYFDAFRSIKNGDYYSGWCSLERAEICLMGLKRHMDDYLFNKLDLNGISIKIEQWQSLFPYKMFYSPEMVAKAKKCSICGKSIGIRNRCEHIVGELYRGEMCYRIVTGVALVGISLVENPVQKYSVAFLTDEKGERRDHYDYSFVDYAAKLISTPFVDWGLERTKALHPHDRYSDCSPDGPCPCEGEEGLSYKDCCLKRDGVIRPHIQLHLAEAPPEEIPPIIFSSDLRPIVK